MKLTAQQYAVKRKISPQAVQETLRKVHKNNISLPYRGLPGVSSISKLGTFHILEVPNNRDIKVGRLKKYCK